MGVIARVWKAVTAGIILLLATRHASKISSSGSFVGYFVALLALLLLAWALEYEFLLATPKRLAQFDSLRVVVMSLAELFILYASYVLAAQITEWFDKSFMNGPYLFELVLVIGVIIAVITVCSVHLANYSVARNIHVDHLGKISDQAVEDYRQQMPA